MTAVASSSKKRLTLNELLGCIKESGDGVQTVRLRPWDKPNVFAYPAVLDSAQLLAVQLGLRGESVFRHKLVLTFHEKAQAHDLHYLPVHSYVRLAFFEGIVQRVVATGATWTAELKCQIVKHETELRELKAVYSTIELWEVR